MPESTPNTHFCLRLKGAVSGQFQTEILSDSVQIAMHDTFYSINRQPESY